MMEFRVEVKNDINSLREYLNVMNDSVNTLSMCLQEHKKQTETELADLHTSLEKVQDFILEQYWCGGTRGWKRVVYLDMTDPNTTCPSGWNMTRYSKRTCGRATDGANTRDSATFPVREGEYSRICGRIRAYQYASTDGFVRFPSTLDSIIDDAYIILTV